MMSSGSKRHSSRPPGGSTSSGHSRGSPEVGGTHGVNMAPSGRSTRPQGGSTSSRHSGGNPDAGGMHGGNMAPSGHNTRAPNSRHSRGSPEVGGTHGVNMAPSRHSTRPRGDSSSSRNSGGNPGLAGSGISSRPSDGVKGSRNSSGSYTAPVGSGVSMRPAGGSSRPTGGSTSTRGSNKSASLQDVDLNVSQGSEQSVVTLGGVEYPIGSRIGKSGMFVIGDPAGFPRHDMSSASYRSSMPSVSGSQAPMYRGDGKGYNFEYWNWPIIRFVCFIFVCIVMVGLLAGTITVAIQHKTKCEAHFLWWQGATFYNIPVPYFHDSDNSKVGDFIGIEKKQSYLEYMGHEAVVLQNFLWSEDNDWNKVMSFTEVDHRLGSKDEFNQLVEFLHGKNIQVLLQICPWFTSKEHAWYIESRESSITSLVRNFYIWSPAPNPSADGKWEFDLVRNQYYLYQEDSNKPLLNWNDTKLVDTFTGILENWLKLGVDGFVLCGLEKFHINFDTEIYSILGRFHETLNSYSQGDDKQKVLVVDSSYVEKVHRTYAPLLSGTLERVDLIQAPFSLVSDNATSGLKSLLENQLQYQAMKSTKKRPWILWNLSQLKELQALDLGGLELVMLMVPGTPMYTAGQEIGVFYMESEDRYKAPMLWQAETISPYNPGGPLPQHNIEALHNVSTERKKTFSLRLDTIPDTIPDEKTESLNYKIIELDSERQFLLFSRFYTSDNTYYCAVNFGDTDLKKNFAQVITPWATVLADSSNKYQGRLELKEVVLEPGQAIVFYPTK